WPKRLPIISQGNQFIERKEVWEKIKHHFGSSSSQQGRREIWLNGPGGVGKTQLAAHFMRTFRSNYKFIIWFDARNLDTEYMRFEKEINISRKEHQNTNAIEIVQDWFEQNPGWLIIYDDTVSYEEISKYLPYPD